MSYNGNPFVVKLCAATNNSSSEEMASSTSTTTDGDDDMPTFDNWCCTRSRTSSPHDDTDHTSLVVQASSSSRSMGELPQGGAVMMELPNILDSISPRGSATPLLDLEGSAAEMSRMQVAAKLDKSILSRREGFPDRKSDKSSGTELSTSSSKQLEILNNLQAELDETRAALELTEEQLALKMNENDEAADEIGKAWKMVKDLQAENEKTEPIQLKPKHSKMLLHIFQQIELEGGPEKAWLSQNGLQAAILHLYMSREDAVFSKKFSQDQVGEISKQCQILQGKLTCLITGLQGIVLGKREDEDEDELIFELEIESERETSFRATAASRELCSSLLEQLKAKLHSKALQAARWQMITAQLRRELDSARQRCEEKMEMLTQVEEECHKRKEEAQTERDKTRRQDEQIQGLNAKVSECNNEIARSHRIHQELEARINRLSEQLHKAVKDHEETTKCNQKVTSLEEELKIAKTTCNELWEQHQDITTQLTEKTAELDQIQSGSSDKHKDNISSGQDDQPSIHTDHMIDPDVIQEIHKQFDQHMILADELESERQRAHQLRDARLAQQEAACLEKETELSKEYKSLQDAQRQQEITRQRMEDERRSQEERVKQMTESLLEVTQARGHLTSDLTQTQQEVEVIRRQLLAATITLDYERQAKDALQTKYSKMEEQVLNIEKQLTSFQQNNHIINQKLIESQRQVTSLQTESEHYRQEYERVAASLKQKTKELQDMECKTAVTTATKELETNAKLTEGAILNSDLGMRLEAVTAEKNDLSDRVKDFERRLRDYDQKQSDLEEAKSCCEQLESQVTELQNELTLTQSSLRDVTSKKEQQDADIDVVQEELNTTLSRQAVIRKKFRRQKARTDSALTSLGEERDILTNQLTEASKNLTNIQQQLKTALDTKQHLTDDKHKLSTACNTLEKQRSLVKDELQRALCQAENIAQQLEEEKKIKNEYQEQLTESTSKLVSMETTLSEERSKVKTLSTEVFALRDTNRSKKNQIVELTGQIHDLQLELQSSNHKHELHYTKLMSASEKTISQLEKTCESQEDELKELYKANRTMEADLDLQSHALTKKQSDYNRALMTLHKAEMKEKELTVTIHRLEGQLHVEKDVQDELNKSCECQEVELQKLRRMKHEHQDIEQLKDKMEYNTKMELQHIKAELTQEIFNKIKISPQRENSTDRDKLHVQELEAELSKLRGLRSVDKVTISSLKNDVQKLHSLLAKQKRAMLKRKSCSKTRKDDIQAALAKAHVRALSMSMADNCPTMQSPLFDTTYPFQSKEAMERTGPSYGSWETKSSDSITTCSSDDDFSS